MRLVIQRVKNASVTVEDVVIAKIDQGLLLLVGVEDEDTVEDANYLVRKTIQMRIFSDEEGKMNLSVQDVNGRILSVSQFTLHANTRKGNRPSFIQAGHPTKAKELYDYFNQEVAAAGVPVQTGEFGAMMDVSLVNDGPVTILIDSKNK